MKSSKIISLGCFPILCAAPSYAAVADLEALQAANADVAYQFTFEGATEAEQLSQKVGAGTPDLIQAGSQVGRDVDFLTPGYDSSTRYADFLAFASGAQGDALDSDGTVTYNTSGGTIEFLVRPGAVTANNFMISGYGGSGNSRWRFLSYDGTTATTTVGSNTPRELFGGSTGVTYTTDDWYYVAQTWSITGTTVTLNAWSSNLSDPNPTLTKVVNNLSNTFDGPNTATLYLGSLAGSLNYADGGLDSLAIYDAILSDTTIQSHFDAIPEPSSYAFLAGLSGLAVVLLRRRR